MFPPLSWIRLLFYRAEAAQGLQRRSRVRDRGVAVDPGGFRSFPDLRSASMGDESVVTAVILVFPVACYT